MGETVASYFTATSTTATSTFANGIYITSGCFRGADGSCISSGGGGSGTVNTGSAGYLSYYPSGGTTVDDASNLYWDNTNSRLGIGTSSPYAKLSVVGETVASYFSATSTVATSTLAGGLNVGSGRLVSDFSSGNTWIGNGNLGIRTTTPLAPLHILSTTGYSSTYANLWGNTVSIGNLISKATFSAATPDANVYHGHLFEVDYNFGADFGGNTKTTGVTSFVADSSATNMANQILIASLFDARHTGTGTLGVLYAANLTTSNKTGAGIATDTQTLHTLTNNEATSGSVVGIDVALTNSGTISGNAAMIFLEQPSGGGTFSGNVYGINQAGATVNGDVNKLIYNYLGGWLGIKVNPPIAPLHVAVTGAFAASQYALYGDILGNNAYPMASLIKTAPTGAIPTANHHYGTMYEINDNYDGDYTGGKNFGAMQINAVAGTASATNPARPNTTLLGMNIFLKNSSTSDTGAGTGLGAVKAINIAGIDNSGRIESTYGVYVGDITAGSQTNTPYSFYASDANAYNYFAGNTGIGTSTPSSKFTVDNGSTATTTVEFGDQYSSNSKTCFNAKNTAGGNISFYFIGTTMVAENNRCN